MLVHSPEGSNLADADEPTALSWQPSQLNPLAGSELDIAYGDSVENFVVDVDRRYEHGQTSR